MSCPVTERYTAPAPGAVRQGPSSPRIAPAAEGAILLRNTIRAIALAASLAAGAAHAAQPVSPPANPVVWDKGPSTGPAGDVWSNQTAGQNFADSVTLAHTTFITGFNYFTVFDLSGDNASDAFHLKVLADAGGQPGAYLTQEDIGFTSVESIGGGIDELSFTFAPIEFTAGTTYWIGLSGNGFEAAAAVRRSTRGRATTAWPSSTARASTSWPPARTASPTSATRCSSSPASCPSRPTWR